MVLTTTQTASSPSLQWCSLPSNWHGEAPKASPHSWVKLLTNPQDDPEEALLLCQEDDWTWVAWLPSRGETRLEIGEFCIYPN
ncbi:MAG: hypothetical protein ACKO1W_11450 [Microcystaceae cyanobacterium]